MTPLAHLLRPKNLTDFSGQSHLVGKGKPIWQLVNSHNIFSMILWGPPGCGKTTLARILAENANRQIFELSAVSAGKKQVQEIIAEVSSPQANLANINTPVLFIDEIHRFNKAQQDYLLPYVENGTIILIGATTENPSFEIIAALLSRCRVFVLRMLDENELVNIIDRAVAHLSRHLQIELTTTAEAKTWLVNYADGDARRLLTIIDNTVELYKKIDLTSLLKAGQTKAMNFDKDGEDHYNTTSAFIKSMRASNPDAALYYLARLVEGGEDPKFIARRMVIFASEDIGLAQPTALVVANAVFDAVHKIGYPEAQINLAHGVAYLAQAKKNRNAYDAYFSALADVKKFGNLPIPMELLNAPTQLMKNLGYGKGYEMYPDKNKSLLPSKLKDKHYLK